MKSPVDLLLDRLPIRRRLGADPLLAAAARVGRFAPLPLDRLKVTGNLRGAVLARRQGDPGLSIAPDQRLAIIIPFRNRDDHLATLLPALEEQVRGHCAEHRLIVVEQAPGRLFNRARLINIGAAIAGATADYFCIHDVDMVPVSAEYGCPSQPLRLVKQLTRTFRPVNELTGCYFSGAIAVRRDQFLAANGFDNDYWGSGSQDEDFFMRCLLAGLVPYEDREGVFSELDNPAAEQSYRTKRIRRGNQRRLIWQCYRRTIGRSGMSDLRYRLLRSAEDGRITRALVEP